jgi:hypothetical protein
MLIQICKIINYILISFNNKINYNKIYKFYNFFLNKMNGQTYLKKSTMTIIKIQRFTFSKVFINGTLYKPLSANANIFLQS